MLLLQLTRRIYQSPSSDSKTLAFLFVFQTVREQTRKHWAITSMRCRAGKRRKERETEKEKEKGDGTRRRSAQPPITRCQRRQAVIRRLNSRSSRSVFVRVNLHQVSIFRAFRCDAMRCEARRGEVRRTVRTPAASPLRSAEGQKAPSPLR